MYYIIFFFSLVCPCCGKFCFPCHVLWRVGRRQRWDPYPWCGTSSLSGYA